jgi:signal transduction histidine kinase
VVLRQFGTRVLLWQLGFSGLTIALVYLLPGGLLLLPKQAASSILKHLCSALALAGLLSALLSSNLVFRRASILRAAFASSPSFDLKLLPKLNDDPWKIVNYWVYSQISAAIASVLLFESNVVPLPIRITLGVFTSILVATASLPLLVAVRHEFVKVLERVPPEIMSEVIDAQVALGRLRGRTSRRLLAAIVTPVVFLGFGTALIVGSHHAAFEERVLERTWNELGEIQGQTEAGRRLLKRPTWPLDWKAILVGVSAVVVASYIGRDLAFRLSRDLSTANRGVRMLGTEAALEGTRVMRPARFRAVEEFGMAIELLSDRFRTFAQAQEQFIEKREAAMRARGRFFASVSHDLKSPLNAIVGFAELTKRDPSTNAAQRDSLELILQGGTELLALIETILDAARVEAGQLVLEYSEEPIEEMLTSAVEKAKELSVHSNTRVIFELPQDLPRIVVDKLRFPQALATFIAHARRTAERDQVRILVEVEAREAKPNLERRKVTFFIEVPSSRFSAQELEAVLSPETHPGQHRGMALALRLAKSILELHGGNVSLTGRTVTEPAFAIQMRTRPGQ